MIETKWASWVIQERTQHKRLISYNLLRNKALAISREHIIFQFLSSNCWIENFLERNGLSVKKITCIGQEDNTSIEDIRSTVIHQFEALNYKISLLRENE